MKELVLASRNGSDLRASGKPRQPFGLWTAVAGFVIIVVFAGALGAWAAIVPLESAVVAQGTFKVRSSARTIQHLEGGIIDEIHVRDGDRVKAGDVLIRLRPTIPMAELNRTQAELHEAKAAEARLIAERDRKERISFPGELADDTYGRDAVNQQESIFASRKKLLDDRMAILGRTVQGLEHVIEGLEGQIAANKRQIALFDEQLIDTNQLLEKGLIQRPRVLELEREKAEREGDVSRFTSEIGAARQRIEEINLRMVESQASQMAEIVVELREVRAKAYELSQKISAARDVMSRTEVRAPVDGIVMRQRVHTIGGVAGATDPLMDIVPVDDELVVMATIDPRDVDQVKTGQDVAIWLSATHRRHDSPLRGKVLSISADQIEDSIGLKRSFYLAKIQLDPKSGASDIVSLQPGMSAEVMIRTGAHNAWSYIAAPIRRSMDRALREQ